MERTQLLWRLGVIGSDQRPWGSWIRYEDPVCFKTLRVEAGGELSLQRHKHRAELWVILEGSPLVTVGPQSRRLVPGDTVWISIGEIHRLLAIDGPALVLELQFGLSDEADIERLADRYGRAPTLDTT